ncbi:MAG: hypothetical protein IT236_13620 [Bacteroidia bacterium]|nr:hypothetical protein [Bacteroidia bacterium]
MMNKRILVLYCMLATWYLPCSAQFKIKQSRKVPAAYSQLIQKDSADAHIIKGSVLVGIKSCKSPYGDIYLTGTSFGSIAFKRSYDRGITWHNTMRNIEKTQNAGNYNVHGGSTNGLPQIVCDTLGKVFKDRIYICWGDEKYGKRNKDVFLAYSDDRGDNWTEPILVTYRPNHKEQFKPSMALNQANGNLYLLYFDCQNYVDSGYTDLYLAESTNGGLKFDYYKINKSPIKLKAGNMPDNKIYIAANNEVEVMWKEFTEKGLPVYNCTIMRQKDKLKYNANYFKNELSSERTFTYSDTLAIQFSLKKKTVMSAILSKPIEPGFETEVVKDLPFSKGTNVLMLPAENYNLKKGNYILTFYYEGRNSYVWITE